MCIYTDLLERLLNFQFFYVKVDTMVILQVIKFWDLNVWLCVSTGVKFIENSEYLLRRKGFAVFHQPAVNICKELCFIPSCCIKELRNSAVGSVDLCPKYQKQNLPTPKLQTSHDLCGKAGNVEY